MRFKCPLIIILVASIFTFSNTACKKEKLLSSGGELRYSLDTVTFDTVFTTLGSFTTQVKLYNPQNQKVNISSIRLAGQDAQYFNLNFNGIGGKEVTNVELEAKDSMYIFATVTIDPKPGVNIPFVINAEIVATLNGKDFKLPLQAYGQDAYYIRDSVLKTQTWKTDKPYVIIHNALVDEGQTLTLPAGCRIYVHADSRLFVLGTLKANGTKKDSIVFQGDRLDRKYFGNEGYPGEWGGIYFDKKSSNNTMDWVVLKNCGNTTSLGQGTFTPAAIQLAPDTINDGKAQLEMRHCIIDNSIGYGILGFGSTIIAENCLINSCGAQALATFEGGGYYFNNCDFITYGNKKLSHTDNPTVAIINYRDVSDESYIPGNLICSLQNCIIWGSLDKELFALAKGPGTYDVNLINCIVKSNEALYDKIKQTQCLIDYDPQFTDHNNNNFRLKDNSPARDKGVNLGTVTDDLDGRPRTGTTDIGCYEY